MEHLQGEGISEISRPLGLCLLNFLIHKTILYICYDITNIKNKTIEITYYTLFQLIKKSN